MTDKETCTICGKPAMVYGYHGAAMVPRCSEHGVLSQIRSQADIDRITALETEHATLPRPAIMAFARLMEAKLATKDALGYPDWRKETPLQHLWGIQDEVEELRIELAANDGDGSRDAEARWEAVDVALRAMMEADRLEPLCKHDGRGNVKETRDAQD